MRNLVKRLSCHHVAQEGRHSSRKSRSLHSRFERFVVTALLVNALNAFVLSGLLLSSVVMLFKASKKRSREEPWTTPSGISSVETIDVVNVVDVVGVVGAVALLDGTPSFPTYS